MYALASLGLRRSVAAFAWQAWDLVALQGVCCTLWCCWGSAALSLLLRGRRGIWWHCRGSDVLLACGFGVLLCVNVVGGSCANRSCANFEWMSC